MHTTNAIDSLIYNTVKPVTRGHLNVKIGMSKLHFLWTKIYFNIEMHLRRGDTCHVGTLFEVSPRHRFHCTQNIFSILWIKLFLIVNYVTPMSLDTKTVECSLKSLLSNIVNRKLQHNCPKYHLTCLMKTQQNPIILRNSLTFIEQQCIFILACRTINLVTSEIFWSKLPYISTCIWLWGFGIYHSIAWLSGWWSTRYYLV